MVPLLQTQSLRKYFPVSRGLLLSRQTGWVKAVDEVNISIGAGETVGVVGESGCGKTTVARLLLLLESATAGSILFEGNDVRSFGKGDLARYRKSVQAVFQNPFSSLNPKMQAGTIIAEPLTVDRAMTGAEREKQVARVLDLVGLDPAAAKKFPHEFSGGQRQRVAIARALACNPRLIILDEPVSAQDVSIRAQLLNLLRDLQKELGISFLFIGHDLATVKYMCHRIVVMYLGKIVEAAPGEDLNTASLHPYTRALYAASLPDRPGGRPVKNLLVGEVPSPLNPPDGCRFHTRCPNPQEQCSRVVPSLKEIRPGHSVACLRYQ